MSTLLNAASLSFRYADRPVLREASLALSTGEVVSLLGPNGAGKTTLIRVLLGHLSASGTIEWQGRALSAWNRKELARLVAYLPQSPTSDSSQTVLETLRLGRAAYWGGFGVESERDIAVVRGVADQLSLGDLLNRRLDELSGGQRQRVFVGRCLAQEPAALLLDEPSTYLDLRHQVELLALVNRMAREKQIAVLMASHDLNLAARFSDRLLLMHEGRIVTSGDAGAVLEPHTLTQVYGVPIERIDRGNEPPIVFPSIYPTLNQAEEDRL